MVILIWSYIGLMVIRGVEVLFIKTDQTWIGENIIHKICCIVVFLIVAGLLKISLKDFGFRLKGLGRSMLYGLLLGISTFSISYFVEYVVLACMGKNPRLSFYITNFSFSETNVLGFSTVAVVVCLAGNIVNVVAEEGLFRGLYIQLAKKKYSFKKANLIQAILFGVWHINNVYVAVLDGSMTIPVAIFMAVGYISLAAILAYEWGLCIMLTGTIWVGMTEHLFNNFISNSLHMVTVTGADELQIIRIVLSNILSLTFVLIAAKVKERKHGGDQ